MERIRFHHSTWTWQGAVCFVTMSQICIVYYLVYTKMDIQHYIYRLCSYLKCWFSIFDYQRVRHVLLSFAQCFAAYQLHSHWRSRRTCCRPDRRSKRFSCCTGWARRWTWDVDMVWDEHVAGGIEFYRPFFVNVVSLRFAVIFWGSLFYDVWNTSGCDNFLPWRPLQRSSGSRAQFRPKIGPEKTWGFHSRTGCFMLLLKIWLVVSRSFILLLGMIAIPTWQEFFSGMACNHQAAKQSPTSLI